MANSTLCPPAPGKMIASLDAFRGFIMFSIILLEELSRLPIIGFIYSQLNHVS